MLKGSEIINEVLGDLGIKAPTFADEIGLTYQRIFDIQSGKTKRVSFEVASAIVKRYKNYNVDWLRKGIGEKFVENKVYNDVKEKTYKHQLAVKVVSSHARAGFSEAYYSDEYLEDMPTILIETTEPHKGKYLAFEVDGDSMEPDYMAGDVVICREVPRANWKYKLHINQWDFVIAHGTQGIMLKEIIDHNPETGDIICHSINAEMHPDFTLNLREVAYIYNVVEHRISGKWKRRRGGNI